MNDYENQEIYDEMLSLSLIPQKLAAALTFCLLPAEMFTCLRAAWVATRPTHLVSLL